MRIARGCLIAAGVVMAAVAGARAASDGREPSPPIRPAPTELADRARALLEQIQELDARHSGTAQQRARAATERDTARRELDEARALERDLRATEARSRGIVASGASGLWHLHGRETLSGLLNDADRARALRRWRSAGLVVRYATAAMQVHAARLADQSALASDLELHAAALSDLERKVSAMALDLEHEQAAKRALLASILEEHERAVEASRVTGLALDSLVAAPAAGPSARPPDSSSRTAPGPRAGFAAWKGRLEAPLEGTVVSRFGDDRDTRGQTVLRSNGVRFAAEPETPVRATLDGRVVYRGYVAGLGNVVILEHGDDYFTVYGHLGEVRALAGRDVARGEVIAVAGSTGLTDEPGVYFEIRHGGEALDPRRWLEPERSSGRRAKGSRGRT